MNRSLRHIFKLGRRFEPAMDVARREELYSGWERAVERAKGWAEEGCSPWGCEEEVRIQISFHTG